MLEYSKLVVTEIGGFKLESRGYNQKIYKWVNTGYDCFYSIVTEFTETRNNAIKKVEMLIDQQY